MGTRRLVPADLAGALPPGMPTVQLFTSGSGTYQPTSSLVQWVEVEMIGGGGGGGGVGDSTGVGGVGGTTSFGAWSALGGGGGQGAVGSGFGQRGSGGYGGTSGPGVLVDRWPGTYGQTGASNYSPYIVSTYSKEGPGWGNVGAGGMGSTALVNTTGSCGGGGGGETVKFMMTVQQASGVPWVVGAGGAPGAISGNVAGAQAGNAGRIRIFEYYTPALPPDVMAANAAAAAATAPAA